MSFGKLYGYRENARTIVLLMLAKHHHLDIELVHENPHQGLSQSYLQEFPKGKIPGFKGSDGFQLTETNAIAFYFANQNTNTTLLGTTKQDTASIIQWMSFANTDILRALGNWVLPLVGKMPYSKKAVEEAQNETNRLCSYVDSFLKPRTFLVGEHLTLADLVMAAHLNLGFLNVFEKQWRSQYHHLTRWFVTVIHQDIWANAIPIPTLIESAVTYVPKPAVAKEPTPKQESFPQPKSVPLADLETSHAEKKEKHPLESAPLGSFVMDEWKRQYSNQSITDAMAWFWDHFDPDAYSLWRVDYKYNDELSLIFQSANLCRGFFQRLEASRKYLFGTLIVYGKNHHNLISGVFLVRGKDFKPAFDVAPDWDSYTFTALNHTDAADKKLIESSWTRKDPLQIGEEIYPVADDKVFK